MKKFMVLALILGAISFGHISVSLADQQVVSVSAAEILVYRLIESFYNRSEGDVPAVSSIIENWSGFTQFPEILHGKLEANASIFIGYAKPLEVIRDLQQNEGEHLLGNKDFESLKSAIDQFKIAHHLLESEVHKIGVGTIDAAKRAAIKALPSVQSALDALNNARSKLKEILDRRW